MSQTIRKVIAGVLEDCGVDTMTARKAAGCVAKELANERALVAEWAERYGVFKFIGYTQGDRPKTVTKTISQARITKHHVPAYVINEDD